jgi:hypothetical protein
MVLVLLILTVVSVAQAPVPEPVTDQETELGQAMYKQLRDKGEIIESSPLYDNLKPIAEAIPRSMYKRFNRSISLPKQRQPDEQHMRVQSRILISEIRVRNVVILVSKINCGAAAGCEQLHTTTQLSGKVEMRGTKHPMVEI